MRIDRFAIGAGKAVAVSAILLWSLLPIAFIVLSSIKPAREIFAIPPRLAFAPTWRHYADLWLHWGSFFTGLLNSLLITVGAALLAVALSLVAGLLVAAVADYLLSERPKAFRVEREMEERFAMGAENEVTIKIVNRARRKITFIVKAQYTIGPAKNWGARRMRGVRTTGALCDEAGHGLE